MSNYYKPTNNIIILELYNAIKEDRIPKLIHRLRLYDSEFPENVTQCMNDFENKSKEFLHILWVEKDLLNIMNDNEINIYNSYRTNIQKSDYGRYIVLKYYGGIYVDYDIVLFEPLINLYNIYGKNDLFFEEATCNNKLRIANYIIISKPKSKNIDNILNTCELRKDIPILEHYDVLYTTGPDVISTCFNNTIDYLSLKDNKYILHLAIGEWHTKNKTE